MKKKILGILFVVICIACVFTLASCKDEVKDHEYVYLGEYPQTIKANDVTITETTNEKGYFLGSDGAYYAKVVASPSDSENYVFSNGEAVKNGSTYYFKVEPIKWVSIKGDNGKSLLVCDTILTNHRFDDNSNKYEESEIRAWLNSELYAVAFSDDEKKNIVDTEVGSEKDKVLLPSYDEVNSNEFLLDDKKESTSRQIKASDYALATGVLVTLNEDSYGNGFWWLRTESTDEGKAKYIYHDGFLFGGGVAYEYIGVVPVIYIKNN